MKLNILSAWRRSLGTIGALLVLGNLAGAATAQNPPYGKTWDCLMSGSGQQGIAFLTFSNDFTFSGYQLLVSKQSFSSSSGSSSTTSTSERGGDAGRSESTEPVPIGNSANGFGYARVDGRWGYDTTKGRVVGSFLQVLNQQTSISTNQEITTITGTTVVYQTNLDGSITSWVTNVFSYSTNTTYLTNTTGSTNGISFSAKVVPGKSLNLLSSTPNGKVTYKGVPQDSKPIPAPIIGRWLADKKQAGQDIVEFFTLIPTGIQSIYYTTNGEGPDLKFGGVSMVSVQKKMGFQFATFEGLGTNDIPRDADGNFVGGTLSVTIGPVSYPKKGTTANTKGFEQPISSIKFNAQRQAP